MRGLRGWARAARALAGVWRFNGLQLAERAFRGVPPGTVLERPLFGGAAPLDVSRTSVHRQLFLEGERFVDERFLIRELLSSGDVVCDVGANIGYYLLLAEESVGARGELLCIEPEPDNLVDLYRLIATNRFQNVRVIAAACGDRPGHVRLARGINSGIQADGELTVPMVTLDEVASPRTNLLKIDVEGFEGQVLAGARRLLRESRPAIFLEVHPGMIAAPYTTDDIMATIREHYSDVRLFAPRPRRGLPSKIAARYLGVGVVESIMDMEALLAACRRNERRVPFWVIARR
jgi:FkbM family methyltransferase